MTQTSISIRLAASVVAVAMLGIQVMAAYEYTEGGSLYSRASALAACLVLAVLPMFIEAARRSGAYVIAVAQAVAFVAFLTYSLPATVGRTGEVKEVKAQQEIASTVDKARVAADYAQTQALVAEAQIWVAGECKSGKGTKCDGVSFILRQRQASLEKLTGEMKAEPVRVGDVGSMTLAWASQGSVSAETIRRGSGLAFALGLDTVIWALMGFVALTAPRRAITERQEPITDAEIEDLRRVLSSSAAPLTNGQLAQRLAVSKGEASKRVSRAVSAGVLNRARIGREVAVSLIN